MYWKRRSSLGMMSTTVYEARLRNEIIAGRFARTSAASRQIVRVRLYFYDFRGVSRDLHDFYFRYYPRIPMFFHLCRWVLILQDLYLHIYRGCLGAKCKCDMITEKKLMTTIITGGTTDGSHLCRCCWISLSPIMIELNFQMLFLYLLLQTQSGWTDVCSVLIQLPQF